MHKLHQRFSTPESSTDTSVPVQYLVVGTTLQNRPKHNTQGTKMVRYLHVLINASVLHEELQEHVVAVLRTHKAYW